jgi:hypothetical protein
MNGQRVFGKDMDEKKQPNHDGAPTAVFATISLRDLPDYCRVLTREGTATLRKPEYERIIRRRDHYGMFIDGMTRETLCGSNGGDPRSATLTPREAGILVDVIQAGKPVRPHATRTGGACASPEAASRLFEEARRKADVKLGRYEFRAFRTHRSPSNRKLKAFEFAPPDELEYCVIVPV